MNYCYSNFNLFRYHLGYYWSYKMSVYKMPVPVLKCWNSLEVAIFFLFLFPPTLALKRSFYFTPIYASHCKLQVVYNTQYNGKNKNCNKPLLNVAGPLKSFFSSFGCRRSYSEQKSFLETIKTVKVIFFFVLSALIMRLSISDSLIFKNLVSRPKASVAP